MEEKFIKIVIDLPEADDGVGGEGIWSVQVGEDLYEVRNSPWHSTDINYLDVVRANAPGEDKKPVVKEVVHRRGHRTIHVVFSGDGAAEKEHVMKHLKELGATYEGAHSTLYALDLEPEIDFDVVANYLAECEEKGWLSHRFADQPQPKGSGDLVN
ncbi:MAG TPA: DUF4265 domain-containing protein [Acidobacteriaceae bacterium]|nr:DUF4265 domain-containing protein [Acidobacteriaceae bacterium]